MRNLVFVGVVAMALSVAPACATKKFVRTSVGEVNDKVGTMGKSLEETQERVKTSEGRIVEVDAKAGAANAAAVKANAAAADAATAAGRAAEVGADKSLTIQLHRPHPGAAQVASRHLRAGDTKRVGGCHKVG